MSGIVDEYSQRIRSQETVSYTHLLKIAFSPYADADIISESTQPLEELLKAKLLEKGYDVGEIDICLLYTSCSTRSCRMPMRIPLPAGILSSWELISAGRWSCVKSKMCIRDRSSCGCRNMMSTWMNRRKKSGSCSRSSGGF